VATDWLKLLMSLFSSRTCTGTPATGGSVSIKLGSGYKTMQKPMTVWRPSPNFAVLPGRKVECVVIHATATPSLASPLAWLCDPKSKVSAHYLIDLDGAIYHLVLDEHVAWHAGVSSWKGRHNVNQFSVGIELVSKNDGTPYPGEQVYACAKVCRYLQEEHGIADSDIVSHAMVAPGRKNDPLGFDFTILRQTMKGIV
jgi:N-acetyl-anhydromuramyl-L-alanine amidase AmpD